MSHKQATRAARRCSKCGEVRTSTATRFVATGPVFITTTADGRTRKLTREQYEELLAGLDPASARMVRSWTETCTRGSRS